MSRRSEIAAFKSDATRSGGLVTHLIDATDVSIDQHPLLARAARWWRGNVLLRRPRCIGCRTGFVEGAAVGAFLFSTTSAAPSAASVSALCARCWREMPDHDIERAAVRVLRRVLPGAHFGDAKR